MKILFATLLTFSGLVGAWEYPNYSQPQPYNYNYDYNQSYDYNRQPNTGFTQTLPNVFGGEDFYRRGEYMGSTHRNVFGGRDFYER